MINKLLTCPQKIIVLKSLPTTRATKIRKADIEHRQKEALEEWLEDSSSHILSQSNF